jgi:hypothetical protein
LRHRLIVGLVVGHDVKHQELPDIVRTDAEKILGKASVVMPSLTRSGKASGAPGELLKYIIK